MVALLTGNLPLQELASDEIQVLVLSGIAFSSALVGTFLVLRRMTMLANSLSHTILIGIVLAYFFSMGSAHDHEGPTASMLSLLLASLLMGLLTTYLTEFLTKTCRLQEDASIGLVFTSLFALGIVLITLLTRDAHIGTEAVMGNADALHREDLFWVALVAAGNLLLLFLFFKEYQLTTFDRGLAYALGFSPMLFNYLLMTQVSVTAITSFRAVGVILVLAFMTGPVLAARLVVNSNLKSLLIVSAMIGVVSCLLGVAATRHMFTVYGMPLSTTGVVVCTIAALFLACLVYRLVKTRKDEIFQRAHMKKCTESPGH